MRFALALAVAVLLLAAAWAKAGSFPDGPGGPQIAVINQSSLSDTTILADLPVFQAYVDQACEAWHCAGHLYFAASDKADNARDWSITVNDESDTAKALGYHTEYQGAGVAYVSVQTARKYGIGWPRVFTHELGEMLVDVEAQAAENTVCEKTFDGHQFADVNCTFYIKEIADPVQGRTYKLTVDGITLKVSDWVYRNWFVADAPGPYDAARVLRSPFSLYKNSYISFYKDGRWQQHDTFPAHRHNWDAFG